MFPKEDRASPLSGALSLPRRSFNDGGASDEFHG